jgi:tRNA(Ile2) C34 agmatinyltransferase TiaS
MSKFLGKIVLGLSDVYSRNAKRGGKCEKCGGSNTWMADSGKGWGCSDCGHFTDKK